VTEDIATALGRHLSHQLAYNVEPQVICVSERSYSRMTILEVDLGSHCQRYRAKTVRYRDRGPTTSAEMARSEFHTLSRLYEELKYSSYGTVPRPVLLLPQSGTLVTEEASGANLRTIIRMASRFRPRRRTLDHLASLCQKAGEWLAAMHSTTASEVEIFSFARKSEEVDRLVATCTAQGLPAPITSRVQRYLRREAQRPDLPLQLVLKHDDFIPSNMLIRSDGRLIVLDFASAVTGPPHRDPVSFTAYLDYIRADPRYRGRTIRLLKEAFWRGYGTNRAQPDDPIFRIHLLEDILGMYRSLPTVVPRRLSRPLVMALWRRWIVRLASELLDQEAM